MGAWTKYLEKTAGDMPHFLEQDRPSKVKEIYSALKRDHPDMPAEMKARIAARQGKKGKQHQGPPYKGSLTKGAAAELEGVTQKQASLDQALGALYQAYGPTLQKHAAADFYANLDRAQLAQEALGAPFCKLAQASQMDPWVMASKVVRGYHDLVKMASGQPSQAQELAGFYLVWGDEMEKKANLLTTGISNLASKARAVGGALLSPSGALRTSGHMPSVGKRVGQALKKQQTLQQMGGGSIARGRQLHAQNVASRTAPTPAPVQQATARGYTVKEMLGGAGVLTGLGGAGYLASGAGSQPQPEYGGSYA